MAARPQPRYESTQRSITVDGKPVAQSAFREDAGLEYARANGFRGKMCTKFKCTFTDCTFLHPNEQTNPNVRHVNRNSDHQANTFIIVNGERVPQGEFRDDDGLANARAHGNRGRMCSKEATCTFKGCTFLHYKRTAGAEKRHGVPPPPGVRGGARQLPETKLVDDKGREVAEELAEDTTPDRLPMFIESVSEEKMKCIAGLLRSGNSDTTTMKVASHMLHIFCNAAPAGSVQVESTLIGQDVSNALVHDAQKWFKGLTNESVSKTRNVPHLVRILGVLLRRTPGTLEHGFVTVADLLREQVLLPQSSLAPTADDEVWQRYQERKIDYTARCNTSQRQLNRTQQHRNVGPLVYADGEGVGCDAILCNEEDFCDGRDKDTILRSLHGIVVDAPVPTNHGRRHIEEQFQTFREDFVAAMRSAVKVVRGVMQSASDVRLHKGQLPREVHQLIKERDGDGDVRLYNSVRCRGVKLNRSRLVFDCDIDMRQFSNMKVNWDKRMMQGNFVLLSAHWFRAGTAVIAGTVARERTNDKNSNNAGQRQQSFDGIFGLEVEDSVEMLRLVSQQKHQGRAVDFVMLESTAFFLPYQRALSVLKRVLEGTDDNHLFPLQTQLLEGRTDRAPPYIEASHHLRISQSVSLQTDALVLDQAGGTDVLDAAAWDGCSSWSSELEKTLGNNKDTKNRVHCVDATQRDALRHIFSHSVAVVQGTPGTGKTFIGAKFVQIVLQNYARLNCGPIVCICLTNHAIDAFLEQMLVFEDRDNIVRLGSMSKNPEIADLALHKKSAFRGKKNFLETKLVDEFQFRKNCVDRLVREKENISRDTQHSLEELFTSLTTRYGLNVRRLAEHLERTDAELAQAIVQARNETSKRENHLRTTRSKREQRLDDAGVTRVIRSVADVHDYCAASMKASLLDDAAGATLAAVSNEVALHLGIQSSGQPPFPLNVMHRLKESINEASATMTEAENDLKGLPTIAAAPEQPKKKAKAKVAQPSRNELAEDARQKQLEDQRQQLTESISELRSQIATENSLMKKLMSSMREKQNAEVQTQHLPLIAGALLNEIIALVSEETATLDQLKHLRSALWHLEQQETSASLVRWRNGGAAPQLSNTTGPPCSATVPSAAAAPTPLPNTTDKGDDAELLTARAIQRDTVASQRFVDDGDEDNNGGDVAFDDQFSDEALQRACAELSRLLQQLSDFSATPHATRTLVYKNLLWVAECQLYLQLQHAISQLASHRGAFQAEDDKATAAVLRQQTIIGATTAGAAMYVNALRELRPKIVIVEEAAEVLECQVLSCLPNSVQHLILVGDHKQLQPKVEQELILGDKKNLSVSLMERLVRIGAPYETLTTQRRMHPDISLFTKDYYKIPTHPRDKAVDVIDHPSTKQRPQPQGVAGHHRVFFVAHDGASDLNKEKELAGLQSKYNEYEAEVALSIASWMMLCNPTFSVTILAPYSGQVIKLIELARRHHCDILTRDRPRGVKIISIDDYQGEESDIIILTLTRTNEFGFLKKQNRSCVALSRARCAMYIVGCQALLESDKNVNPLLRQLIPMLTGGEGGADGVDEAPRRVAAKFPAVCPNHPHEQTLGFATFAEQEKARCKLSCGAVLADCDHVCTFTCHNSLSKEHSVCSEACSRIGRQCKPPRVCAHPCTKKCKDHCGDCKVKVPYTCPECGDDTEVACSIATGVRKHKCLAPRNAECDVNHNHVIPATCHEVTSGAALEHCPHSCQQPMRCGHKCRRKCHRDDAMHNEAMATCEEQRTALHPTCKRHNVTAVCCEFQRLEQKLLQQGDAAPAKHGKKNRGTKGVPPCKEPCGLPAACDHPCDNTCGECRGDHRCLTGTQTVALPCGHTHHNVKCSGVNTLVCTEPCSFVLGCGHPCPGTCGTCKGSTKWFEHQPCKDNCKKQLVCGHTCNGNCTATCGPCTSPCEYFCGHGTGCAKVAKATEHHCGECPFRQCQDPCKWSCEHKRCSKGCGQPCDREACLERCSKQQICPKGHKTNCLGVCGEQCPEFCRECFRENGPNYAERSNVYTLEVDVMNDELDDFLLGKFDDDEEFRRSVPESNTRLVRLPCCGVIMLAGDLDQHIKAVCGSSEIVAPKCVKCLKVIQPGYYLKQNSMLHKRHQDIADVQQHQRRVADEIDDSVDGLVDAVAALATRCIFGSGDTEEGERWRGLLDDLAAPRIDKPKKIPAGKKRGKAMKDRFEKQMKEWNDSEAQFKQLQEVVKSAVPPTRSDIGKQIGDCIVALYLAIVCNRTSDGSWLASMRTRADVGEALVHFLDVRKQHKHVTVPADMRKRLKISCSFLLGSDVKLFPRRAVLDANVLAFDLRLSIVQDAQKSLLLPDDGSPRHVTKTCEMSEMKAMIDPLLEEAGRAVHSTFFRSLGRARFLPNPCMLKGCSAFQRFAAAVKLEGRSTAECCQIAFHGTGIDAIGPICCRGFDLDRRGTLGQAHGPGEYFGGTPDVSDHYARGSQRMIVVAVLKQKISPPSGNGIIVVNNPLADRSVSYVLPLGVVLYGPHQGGANDAFKCSFPRSAASDAKIATLMEFIASTQQQLPDDVAHDIIANINSYLENEVKAIETEFGIVRPPRELLQAITAALGVTA